MFLGSSGSGSSGGERGRLDRRRQEVVRQSSFDPGITHQRI